MLSENELVDLCHKYQSHQLTETEFRLLKGWIEESEENQRFFSNYVKLYKAEKCMEASRKAIPTKGWAAIEQKRRRFRMRKTFHHLTIAACVLSFVLSTAIYFYTDRNTTPASPKTSSLAELFPNLPQNKVILTLSSGKKIVLDNKQTQTISDNGEIVAESNDHSLDYQSGIPSTLQYNTITVPEGSTFTLTLSDGTEVTLNSITTLRYPVTLQDNRMVELNGEAYFDVAHTGQSFTVKANGKEIRVLGTQFNVSAYPMHNITTTLVEGKVEVKSGTTHRLLSPGQQATVNLENNAIDVKEVNTDIYTSWMTGKYEFDRTPLHHILSQLELWYGVKVVYKDPNLRNIRFDGTLFRNKPLGFSLEIIQQVSNVRFTKENEMIIVDKTK